MAKRKYRVSVNAKEGVVEVLFEGATVSFEQVKAALTEVRGHFAKGYKIKMKGYLAKKSEALKAFMFAIDLLGQSERIVFEEKARYSKAERRARRKRAVELRSRGLSVKEISAEVGVPIKTVYRWLSEA